MLSATEVSAGEEPDHACDGMIQLAHARGELWVRKLIVTAERMGDHVTNIAEQVIYLVTGELPDHPRPKMDNVSQAGTIDTEVK